MAAPGDAGAVQGTRVAPPTTTTTTTTHTHTAHTPHKPTQSAHTRTRTRSTHLPPVHAVHRVRVAPDRAAGRRAVARRKPVDQEMETPRRAVPAVAPMSNATSTGRQRRIVDERKRAWQGGQSRKQTRGLQCAHTRVLRAVFWTVGGSVCAGTRFRVCVRVRAYVCVCECACVCVCVCVRSVCGGVGGFGQAINHTHRAPSSAAKRGPSLPARRS